MTNALLNFFILIGIFMSGVLIGGKLERHAAHKDSPANIEEYQETIHSFWYSETQSRIREKQKLPTLYVGSREYTEMTDIRYLPIGGLADYEFVTNAPISSVTVRTKKEAGR